MLSRIAWLAVACVASAALWAEETPDTLCPVVVTGAQTATAARDLPFTASVVERDQLVENHEPNLLPTLTEQVPGLFVTQRGVMGYGVSAGAAGGMSLRGIASGSGQLLVLIDGLPQYNGIYGHSLADAYQTFLAERVEVLRGPASMLYGSNAMGGVVNIVTRAPLHDGIRTHLDVGAGSYGTVQTEVTNQVTKGRFHSTVAAQYSRTDNHRPNMGFEQYGGFVKLGYDLSDHWKASADCNLTHFNASYPGTTMAPLLEADQWITRGFASLAVTNDYGWTNGCMNLYSSFGRHKINDGYAPGATPQERLFRSRDALTGFHWHQHLPLWVGCRLTAGADYQLIYGRAFYTSRATGEVLDTPDKQSAKEHMHEVAGYLDLCQRFTDWLTVDVGMRYDWHNVIHGEKIPHFGVVTRPLSTAEARLTIDKGFRNPTLKEMYLYPSSNINMIPERLWNYEVSWSQRLLAGRLRYGANVFFMNGSNIIQTINRKNVNVGRIQNVGMEAEASWRVNDHWSLTTNHSYLHMKYHVVAAPQYKGFAGASMRYGQWTATAGLMQICGLFTAVGTADDPTESCTLLSATLGYQAFPWLRLWAKGQNLLAQRYEFYAGHPMPKATFMGGVSVNF